MTDIPKKIPLKYWRRNAEEDYMHTPISVLKYISELEAARERLIVEATDEQLCQHSWVKHPCDPQNGMRMCLKCGHELNIG